MTCGHCGNAGWYLGGGNAVTTCMCARGELFRRALDALISPTDIFPQCPHCGTGPKANLAGLDGKRLVTCACGRSTYGDDVLAPGWAERAGDLAGRLEQIRRLVETLNEERRRVTPFRRRLLDIVDGKVIGFGENK